MSVKIMGAVWEKDLPHNEQSILLAMADHADHLGNKVYPSMGLIAWKTGYSIAAVRRIKNDLVKKGVLILVSKRSGSSWIYRIDLAVLKDKVPYQPERDGIKWEGSDPSQNEGVNPTQNERPPLAQNDRGDHSKQEETPSIATQGESPRTAIEPSSNLSAKKADPHNDFIRAWCEAYEKCFEEIYLVQGGKDGSAVKRLLKLGVPAAELLDLAKWAWDHIDLFNCNQGASISGFASRLNEIRNERRQSKGVKGKPDHENIGWNKDKFFDQLKSKS